MKWQRVRARRRNVTQEIWTDVKGYEGLYQVSNCGRVRSLDHYASNGHTNILYKGKVLVTWLDSRKYYLMVAIRNKKYLVHRLVAEAFIPNPDNLPEVNHLDGDKQNNHVNNLEWCTSKQNKTHAYKNGLYDTQKFRNRKSLANSKKITINGVTKSLWKWSKDLNVSYQSLRWLYDKGGELPNGWKRETV